MVKFQIYRYFKLIQSFKNKNNTAQHFIEFTQKKLTTKYIEKNFSFILREKTL